MIRRNVLSTRLGMLSAALMGMFAPTKPTRASERLSTALLLGNPFQGNPANKRRASGGHDTSIPRPRRMKSHSLRHQLAFKSFS
jgi:hypothetical protein